MSKFTDELKKIDIYNIHNMTSKGHPIIYYNSDCGRGGTGRHWVLSIIGKTFKNQAWYCHGNLWFQKEELEKALAKVKELFPDIEMVKGPWRYTWLPKVDLETAKARLKELKEKQNVN
jgi:hypothetical protein